MSELQSRFEAEMPGHFFLSEEVDQVQAYLIEQRVMPRKRLMKKGATIGRIEPVVLGEMNYAVRVHFGEGLQPHGPSVILKQARPWIEQHPEIKAPVSRSRAEAGFLKMVSRVPELAKASLGLIHHDMGNHVMVLYDLGDGGDLTDLHEGAALTQNVNEGVDLLTALVGYLSTLHAHFLLNPPLRPVVNKGMRKLNHQRLFADPFQGDSAFAKTKEPAVRKRVLELGERFLDFKAGGTLLHGSFRPANFWIGTDAQNTLRILEPASCFTGPPEFDFGVFAAHLHLRDNAAEVERVRELYTGKLDDHLWRGYAGVEILRLLSDTAPPANVGRDTEKLFLTAKSFLST